MLVVTRGAVLSLYFHMVQHFSGKKCTYFKWKIRIIQIRSYDVIKMEIIKLFFHGKRQYFTIIYRMVIKLIKSLNRAHKLLTIIKILCIRLNKLSEMIFLAWKNLYLNLIFSLLC